MKKMLSAFLVLGLSTITMPSIAQYDGAGQRVVILDTGVMNDFPRIGNVYDQLCATRSDRRTPDSTSATDGFVHYEIASTCPSGNNNYTSATAAQVPRVTPHNFSPGYYDNHRFGTPHGSYLIDEVNDVAPATQILGVNVSFFRAASQADDGNGGLANCGPHGPDPSVSIQDSPTRDVDCYSLFLDLTNPNIVNRIIGDSNVAAVNISGGAPVNCSTNSNEIQQIVNSGVAIIAASGNRGASNRVDWPACNNNVISVGAGGLQNGGVIEPYSNSNGIIDFFASGNTFGYDNKSDAGTSYAAPVVAGAFALMRQARPTATIFEMRYALTETALNTGSFINHNGTSVPFVTEQIAQAAATCLANEECLINDDSGTFDAIAHNDAGQYGPVYGDTESSNYVFEIDFDNLGFEIPTAKSGANVVTGGASFKTGAPGQRDVVLSFDAKMASNLSNGFRVYINNNTSRAFTGTFINERSFEYTFKRSLFSSGSNTIRIEPVFGTRPWGLSNVKAEFTPVVELTLGQVDNNTYGSTQNPERPTGMRASFEIDNVDNDVAFAVTGSGINDATEMEVYLNGIEYGFLTQDSDAFGNNPGDTFTFDKGDLIEGTNVIELVQRDGAPFEWSVTNMLVMQERPISSTLVLGVADSTQYGNNYGTDQNTLILNATFTPEMEHDHKISWQAFDVEANGDLDVYLNGAFIKSVRTSGDNNLGTTESITLAWRLFQTGTNTLTFQAKPDATDDAWGVTNILVKTSDVINLENSSSLNKDYGYYALVGSGTPAGWTRQYSGEDYQTRLYATFLNEGKDKIISLRGWDIDSESEMAIYLNGIFMQYVTNTGGSSIYSPTDRIEIPVSSMIAGTNTLSFRATDNFSGFQSEKWGVIFDNIRTKANITPIIMFLLEGESTPP